MYDGWGAWVGGCPGKPAGSEGLRIFRRKVGARSWIVVNRWHRERVRTKVAGFLSESRLPDFGLVVWNADPR